MFLYATHALRQIAAFIRTMSMRVCELPVRRGVHTGVIARYILMFSQVRFSHMNQSDTRHETVCRPWTVRRQSGGNSTREGHPPLVGGLLLESVASPYQESSKVRRHLRPAVMLLRGSRTGTVGRAAHAGSEMSRVSHPHVDGRTRAEISGLVEKHLGKQF